MSDGLGIPYGEGGMSAEGSAGPSYMLIPLYRGEYNQSPHVSISMCAHMSRPATQRPPPDMATYSSWNN